MPDPQLPPGDDRSLRRIRNALLFMTAALFALAGFQAWYNGRLERVREIDIQLAGIANVQGTVSQQLGRYGALAAIGALITEADVKLVSDALLRSRAEALRFDALLQRQADLWGGEDPVQAQAMARWQQARQRLWNEAEKLVWHAELGETEMAAASGRAAQRLADPALEAAEALGARLSAAAQARSSRQTLVLQTGIGITAVLLGAVGLFVAVPTARTLREQMRRLETQTEELSRLALVAKRTDNAVVVTDAAGRIDWVNDAFIRYTGWTLDEVRGMHSPTLLHSGCNDQDLLARVLARLRAGDGVRTELRIARRDGGDFWGDVDTQPLRDAGGRLRGYVSLAADISERRELQRQLIHEAATDALTGLPNRPAALERVRRAIARAERQPGHGFAVLYMDFDRFKQINDSLGHRLGDELLKQMARRIEAALRPGDAVARVSAPGEPEPGDEHHAARLGGDEFVVLLDGVREPAAALAVAERLRGELSKPFELEGRAVQSGVSIGVVPAGSDGRGPDELLRDADTAMYEAKRAGRDRCVLFDAAMHERVSRRLELEGELRTALREGQFFVVYQPIVELAGGRVGGVEALVRWRHPTRGIVAPGEFIEVAEEAGLIDAIGEIVLREACSCFADWRRRLGDASPARLNVNLSRAQLLSPTIADRVADVLAADGLPPEVLQLEITETLAAQDDGVQRALRQLKALGVRLALDDFGVGYSSLACLHLFPVDTVKIDRSFVMHAETVEYHRVLIEATIRVAQALGMKTVAEGIETAGQAELMRRMRCDHGQGWLYGRPAAAAEVEPLFSVPLAA